MSVRGVLRVRDGGIGEPNKSVVLAPGPGKVRTFTARKRLETRYLVFYKGN